MVQRRHAEIAGGGFAGLTAAVALAQRGWSVRVHERAPEMRAFGAGIWVWENGLRVLQALGVREAVLEGAHYPPIWERRDRHDALIDRFALSGSGVSVVCLVRQHLHGSIHAAAEKAGVDLVTESECVDADPAGVLVLADGRRLPADLVVAADGVRSRIRDSLSLVKRRRLHDEGAIRLVLPPAPADDTTLNPDDRVKVIEWWGDQRNMLYTPCGDGVVYLCMTARTGDSRAKAIPVDKEAWTRSFPHLEGMFARIGDEGRWDRFETLRLTRWSVGKVAVIGDAAHSMTPGLGQGMGMAISNALALAVAADAATEGSIASALSDWESSRRPMTEHTQRWSRTWPLLGWSPTMARLVFDQLPLAADWIHKQRARPSSDVLTCLAS